MPLCDSHTPVQIEIKYDRVLKDTESAWLVQFGKKRVWLPKQHVVLDKGYKTVVMPVLMAIDRGIEYED